MTTIHSTSESFEAHWASVEAMLAEPKHKGRWHPSLGPTRPHMPRHIDRGGEGR